jgi:hypothetical protein
MTISEEVRPLSSSAKDDGDFIDLGWRPVFAEHTDREGNRFDSAAMRKITARCNERIEETSDFVPVSIGHNENGCDAEVVGFAGPFRTGEIGKKNKRTAIYAKFRVYKEDYHKIRKYPRLSVELWTSEKRPTEGYFDPISLLGSETPELDLGTRYSKTPRAGQRCVKYSAAFAGGTNVVLPGMVEEKKPKTYEKASKLMLSPEDIQQIVAAMGPVIEAKIAEMNPAPQVDEGAEIAPEGEPDGDEMPPAEGDEAAPADAPPDELNDAPEIGEDKPEEKPEAPPVDADKPDEEDDEPAVKKYQRMADEYQVKYQKAVVDLREITAKHDEMAAVVEGSKREARRAVRYQKLNDLKAQGFVIVPDEEIADVQDMTDAAFGKFTDTVVKKYQRIPLNMIPVPKGIETDSDSDRKRTMYMKEAEKICEAATKAGKHIPFRDACETVRKSYEHKPAA